MYTPSRKLQALREFSKRYLDMADQAQLRPCFNEILRLCIGDEILVWRLHNALREVKDHPSWPDLDDDARWALVEEEAARQVILEAAGVKS